MAKTPAHVLDQIIHWGLVVLAFLLPLFFLTLTPNFFEFNKKALLVLGTGIVTAAWLLKHLTQKTVRFTITPLLVPLLLLTASSFLSSLTNGPTTLQNILDRPLIYASLTLLYVVITSTQTKQNVAHLVTSLLAGAGTLSAWAIINASGLAAGLLGFAPQWLTATSFTPSGSSLVLLTFLTPLFFLSLGGLKRNVVHTASNAVSTVLKLVLPLLVATAMLLTLVQAQRHNTIVLIPFTTSWEIVVENFKDMRPALVGVGPANYVDTFTRNRRMTFNTTPVWNIRFSTSRNEVLQLLTTQGLIGLGFYLALLILFVRTLPRPWLKTREPLSIALVATILTQLLAPVTTLTLFLFVILLALHQTVKAEGKEMVLHLFALSRATDNRQPKTAEIIPWVVSLPLLIALLIGLYLGVTRVYGAEVTFKQSLDAAASNRGTDTYNLQIKAIQKNPREDRYRVAYALTNLALANSLAQKPELGQADRQNITQLIQQAIRESKIAAELNPNRTSNWETVATIYRNLINVAQGAKDWALASYVQAINTDPVNPRLRLEVGGLYFETKEYDDAIRFFGQAVLLKPDWANAHYNLSAAYREKGDLQKAIEEMGLTIRYLRPDTPEYARAQEELAALQTQEPIEETTQSSGELSTPQPLPTPVPEREQIRL